MDGLIPKIFPSSKFEVNYKVTGKILNQKKLVQLMLLEAVGEYIHEDDEKPGVSKDQNN